MTATKICFLWCNCCGKEYAASEGAVIATRRYATEFGWISRRVSREWQDFCGTACLEKREESDRLQKELL